MRKDPNKVFPAHILQHNASFWSFEIKDPKRNRGPLKILTDAFFAEEDEEVKRNIPSCLSFFLSIQRKESASSFLSVLGPNTVLVFSLSVFPKVF